jgi:excisionase family DNA binding protein
VDPPPNPNHLTVDQVAGRLGITRKSVLDALRTKRLRGHQVGPQDWRVTAAAVDKYREVRDQGRRRHGRPG